MAGVLIEEEDKDKEEVGVGNRKNPSNNEATVVDGGYSLMEPNET